MASDSSVFDDPAADHLVLQREQTLAIVLGASEWPFYADFHDAPSFRHSAHDMADYLRAHDGLNLPARNVKVLVDSFDPAPEILEQMWEFIRTRRADLSRNGAPAADLLLYYVGHGGFSDSDAFFLSTRSTNEDDPLATSITAESLGRLVREAAAGMRTYILLDCCFAASASKVFMSGGPVGVAGAQLQDALPPQGDAAAHQNGALPAYGTALLCASGPREPAKAPADLPYTMFTGGVLDVLRRGDRAAPDWLSLDDMQRLVRARLEAQFGDKAVLPQVHAPQQRKGRVDLVPLFHNPAHVVRQRASPSVPGDAEHPGSTVPADPPPGASVAVAASPSATSAVAAPPSASAVVAASPADASVVASPPPATDDRLVEFVPLHVGPERISMTGWLRERLVPVIGIILVTVVVSVVWGVAHRMALRQAANSVTTGVSVTGQASPAAAGQSASEADGAYAAALAEENAGRFAAAAAAYKVLADQGNVGAQFRLGVLYESGRGVPRSDVEAARLFKLAADRGNAQAQDGLGLLYENGRGVPQSYAEAARLLQLSANQGDPYAEVSLALLYERGLGVPRSDTDAVRLAKLAADQGNAGGDNLLGAMYLEGRGVAQSDTKAARLFKLAADAGDATAQTNLGLFYESGRGGLPQSATEAARLFRLAAEQGDARGQYNLGRMYETGSGVPKSPADALTWYRLAARQGNKNAQGALRDLGESW